MKNVNNIVEPINIFASNDDLKRLKYRFRLAGVPPNQAIQFVDIDPNSSIADVKKLVIRSFKLNPIIAIQFIYKGKVLPDNLNCSMFGGAHTKQDVITVMGIMGGG